MYSRGDYIVGGYSEVPLFIIICVLALKRLNEIFLNRRSGGKMRVFFLTRGSCTQGRLTTIKTGQNLDVI